MSREELADAVSMWIAQQDRKGREVAFDANHLGKMERGVVRRPRRHYIAGLCAVLGATEAELGFTPNSAPIQSSAEALADAIGVSGPHADVRPAYEPPRTTPAAVAAIRAMSHAFQTADRRVGGGVLYGTVVRYLNVEIGPRLLDPSGEAGSVLFAAASSVTEIAGWMAHDGGHDDIARRHFDRAYRLASAAAEDALVANVCASMSHLAGQLGQPADAVRIAEAGLSRARTSVGAVRLIARLHAMRARGLATLGETIACVTALTDAEHVLAGVCDEQPAEWIAHFDDGSLASEAALCLRRLGDLTEAERQAHRVIALRSGDRVRSRAFGQLTLAGVLADAGRVDEAAQIGKAVCEVAPSLASARVRARLDRLGKTLETHRTVPEVNDFLTHLATVHHDTEEDMAWPV
jgi:hypothetical protein